MLKTVIGVFVAAVVGLAALPAMASFPGDDHDHWRHHHHHHHHDHDHHHHWT